MQSGRDRFHESDDRTSRRRAGCEGHEGDEGLEAKHGREAHEAYEGREANEGHESVSGTTNVNVRSQHAHSSSPRPFSTALQHRHHR